MNRTTRRSNEESILRLIFLAALTLAGTLLLGCSGDAESPADTGDAESPADTGDVETEDDAATADVSGDADRTDIDATGDAGTDAVDDETAVAPDARPDAGPPPNPDCDPLIALECALPWPSNLYLESDESRVTGYTLAFGPTTLPQNFRRIHVGPDIYRRMDGYGVSTPILVHFPNLDASGLATDFSVARSLADDAPILLFAVRDGDVLERVPYMAELDAWEEDPAVQVLFVRPGVILEEATRYIVAFRTGLMDMSGAAYATSESFAALRDGTTDDDAALSDRQARFDEVFALLEGAGIGRDSLLLAWDFVTASSEAMHGRMLEMRREGLEAAGPDGPEFTITEWLEHTPEEHEHWAAIVRGTIRVPYYMREDIDEDPSGTAVGSTFNEEVDGPGLVEQNGWRDAEFWIGVPHSAMDGTPHGLVQHGHGFFWLGSDTVSDERPHGAIANAGNLIFFGSNWTGMSDHDFGNIQIAVFEMTRFRWLTDRLHQGILEQILFARAMKERFADLPEVTSRGIVIDPDRIYFGGLSQGGVVGATYMALSPDIRRGHLGVGGQNFGLLAHRSENFDRFFVALAGAYPGRSRQAVLLATVGTWWDSTDPASYWRHIRAEPFEDDEPREVLATTSRGDHSVTDLSLEIVARTPGLDVSVVGPYAEARSLDLVESAEYPHTGAGIVWWEWPGQDRVEARNKPAPRGEVNVHDAQRWLPHQQEQMIRFWDTGEIIDVCGGDGCTPD